jgi:uncharacterized protein (TIGR03790 family)
VPGRPEIKKAGRAAALLHAADRSASFPAMRAPAVIVSCLLAVFLPLAAAVPPPESVAVLYNSALPESRELARFYREARGIPAENLIALDMPATPDISRADYDDKIARPLRAEFDRRFWWKRGRDRSGLTLPFVNRIRVLVTLRGVPLRIQPTPKPAPPNGGQQPPDQAAPPKDPLAGRDEAAVDSELAMLGAEGLPLEGVLQNKFYQSEKRLGDTQLPFLMLTSRIDAPSLATCQRMIRDAIDTEKRGLWGMAYVDIANKFPQGDQWLEAIVRDNRRSGIPTVVDRFNETLPANYPMREAALYYGWYDWNANGPFRNPAFRFRQGAVAVHLHSFSAEQLADPAKNWCAPLLERGAAATVGNVYEPYLHLTHDLGLLHRRLLDGWSLVEACWAAMPVASWQGVVLGDPLYQPFRHLAGSGEVRDEDRAFRALRAAIQQWPDSFSERRTQMEKAAARTGNGLFHEALGLDLREQGLHAEAAMQFRSAKSLYLAAEDKLRQDFHIIAMDRAAGRKDLAIRGLRDAQLLYPALPEGQGLADWLLILEPPPPPPPSPVPPPAKS